MAGENTVTSMEKALVKLYSSDATKLEINKNNPVWSRLRKLGDFEGSSYEHTVPLSYGQGIGVTVSDAIDQRSADEYERFSISRRKVYGVGTVSGELIRATKSKRGTVIGQALQTARDNNLENLKLFLRHSLWNNGGGALGRVKSGTISGSTLQLTNPDDTLWLGRGMKVIFSAGDGTSGSAKTTVFTISSINRETGVITFTGSVAGGGANDPANNDYMFRKGTFGQVLHGIPAWIPRTNTGLSTSFLGVNRSQDENYLAGLRHSTPTGASVMECLMLALQRCFRASIEPDLIALNPYDWMTLPMVNQPQVQYNRSGSGGQDLTIGFGQNVKIGAPYGMVEILPDPGVAQGDGWILTMDSWELHYAGDMFPELLKDDGVIVLREPTDDAYTWRYGAMGDIVCKAPRKNMYCALPAVTQPHP